jgi:hypothetical protein
MTVDTPRVYSLAEGVGDGKGFHHLLTPFIRAAAEHQALNHV